MFALDSFCFGIQKTRHLCYDTKKARTKKYDTCTECNSLPLPFQGINILPLCVHLCRSSYSGSLLHSPGLVLTENMVFSQMPLPLCHCTAMLKVLSSVLGFLCPVLLNINVEPSTVTANWT